MDSVKLERHKYIGGSDIPIILGISKFKTRWQLLQEKAQLVEAPEVDTPYIQYGNDMEPVIRDYINIKYADDPFVENCIINGGWRYNADGLNTKKVLEVKTTSVIKENIDEYKAYLSQLLFGMHNNKRAEGLLAVYERPKNLSKKFDQKRLTEIDVRMEDYKDFLAEILEEVAVFQLDVERLKANPLLSEEDFLPNEIVAIANQVLALENQLQVYKELEKQYNQMKEQLYTLMSSQDIKKWEMYNGTKITMVEATAGSTKEVFDEETFKAFHGDLYNQYMTTKQVSGRKGYVKITLRK